MNRFLFLLCTLFWVLASPWAGAQNGKFYDLDQLQSGLFINQLYIDRSGFLWTLTSNGIVQYDGYKFKVLKKGQKNSEGLEHGNVLCMAQSSSGRMYFGFYGSLKSYDGVAFSDVKMYDTKRKPIYCNVNTLFLRKDGTLIAGTSTGGLLLVASDNTAHQMAVDLSGAGEVRKMAEDSQERLWIAAENGVYCYDDKRVTTFMRDIAGIRVYSICTDMAGNVYVGTANRGLYRKQGDQFVHVDATGNDPVPALYADHEGHILVGFDGKGFAVYNPLTGELNMNPYFNHEVELPKSKVYAIAEDGINNVWLGLSEKGIFKHSLSSSGFHYMGYKAGAGNVIGTSNIVCVFVDSNNQMWLGTDKDGIYCLSRDGCLIRHFIEGIPTTILTISEGKDGRVWIGSYGEGGGWLDARSWQYHPLKTENNDFLSITDYVVDNKGRIWAGTMGQGLLMFDGNGLNVRYFRASTKGLSHNHVSQMSLSPDGNRLYVATSSGLNCLNLDDLSWNALFGGKCIMQGESIYLTREYSGVLWLGTTNGLFSYDLRRHELGQYTTEQGLPSNHVTSIERDRAGQLWLGTNMGLSCFNPKTSSFQNYYVDDGLQGNYFTTGASCMMADGQLLFGGSGGITWFNPTDIDCRQWNANVKLTAFTINGVPADRTTLSGSYQVTDTLITESQHFELDYHDNSFAVSFSTLTFDDPERITYLYSINNEPYVALQQGANDITFSHLPSGTYHFRVKAVYKGTETAECMFTVVVHAPWYRTWWAYLLYAALMVCLVWLYLNYLKKKEQQHLLLQEHIHAEELSEAKLRFFMNFSHDIRTPMTLIITPLLQLIKHEDDVRLKGIYDIMRRNAERILGLINQMMDLRIIDQGQMKMRMRETDLIGFIQELYALFEHQARNRQIRFVYDHDADELPVWIDRRYFDKVIVNVLSNAFKFTPTGGEIVINVTHDEQNASVAIRDDGEKIPEDHLEHIFERFYQADKKTGTQPTGTGIGLDLARSLVELHYGTISAHNLAKGCEFTISIPMGCGHLEADEIAGEPDIEAAEQLTMAEVEEVDLSTSSGQSLDNDAESPIRQRPMIIIAEDDEEIREYLVSELVGNYEIKAFADGRQAFEEALRTTPDLIISDIMMPEMDGNTLCMSLRSNLVTSHIPVIMLTAMSMDEDRLEGLTTGADAYIVKPFNMAILLQTVVNLIQRTRTLRLKYEHADKIEGKTAAKSVTSPDEKLLASIIESINRHLDDDGLTIDLIADEVGLSRVHLHRKMKDLTGQTPHDFIRKVRLKKAAELLQTGKMNVSEVTYTCGFSSPTSFSALFKKVYGVSPSQYSK